MHLYSINTKHYLWFLDSYFDAMQDTPIQLSS